MAKRRQTRLRSFLRKARAPYRALRWRIHRRAAIIWRRRFDETIFIGITGSYGKTTATLLLGKMLATKAPTRVGAYRNTPKNVATAILRSSPRKDRYLVHEVAGFELGAVEDSAAILQPRVGIVTTIGGDHRKVFRTPEATASEKAKLVHGLSGEGLAVLNGDDPLVAAMGEGCRCPVAYYGSGENADLRIITISSPWPDRLTIEVSYRGDRFTVRSRLVGTYWATSILAALLAALELGVPRPACLEVIESFEPIVNRMSVHPAPRGAWYVLDGYKSSYTGIEACLGFLDEASVPRKTAIIGTISDFPGASRSHYNRVARMALAKADRVFFTGPHAGHVRRLAAREFADRLLVVERPEDVAGIIANSAIPDELIYIKAARVDGLREIFVPIQQRAED